METHFAEIKDGKVIRVLVADQAFINSGVVGDPKTWVETFPDASGRKNHASVGYAYDAKEDAFYPKQRFNSWTLDKELGDYVPPIPEPAMTKGKHNFWNESKGSWDLMDSPPNKPVK